MGRLEHDVDLYRTQIINALLQRFDEQSNDGVLGIIYCSMQLFHVAHKQNNQTHVDGQYFLEVYNHWLQDEQIPLLLDNISGYQQGQWLLEVEDDEPDLIRQFVTKILRRIQQQIDRAHFEGIKNYVSIRLAQCFFSYAFEIMEGMNLDGDFVASFNDFLDQQQLPILLSIKRGFYGKYRVLPSGALKIRRQNPNFNDLSYL